MEKLIVLGTAGAVTSGQRDNVSLVYRSEQSFVLVECGGSAAHKLAKIGLPYERLEHVIITHTHLDHVYGLPGLIFSIAYCDQQRTVPFRIYCPAASQHVVENLLDLFHLREKFDFPIEIHGVPAEEQVPILDTGDVQFLATPVDHVEHMPTFAVKCVHKPSGRVWVYSSDTGYSECLIRLARHADLLFHECAGLAKHPIPQYHSRARLVGQVARESGVKKVVLVHLDMVLDDAPDALKSEVQEEYKGDVIVASDFDEFILEEG